MVNLNERIQVGLIGCGGMGRGNLANCARYANVAVTGVCDVWPAQREAALAQYHKSTPSRSTTTARCSAARGSTP